MERDKEKTETDRQIIHRKENARRTPVDRDISWEYGGYGARGGGGGGVVCGNKSVAKS